jgi:hypothetical protein
MGLGCYLLCVYALIFESTFEYTNVNVHMRLFVETASLVSAILQTPPCSSTTMTDVHDTSELLNPVDVGTERSAL